MIDVIEQAIIDRLKGQLPGINLVDTFPDGAAEYERLPWQKGVVLVGYKGSQFSKPRTPDLVVQEQQADFLVQLGVKNLKTHQGAYAHLKNIRRLLTGFRAGGAKPLYPVNEEFVDAGDFRWIYSLTFTCSFPHVEERQEETLAPFTSAILKSVPAQTTTEVQL